MLYVCLYYGYSHTHTHTYTHTYTHTHLCIWRAVYIQKLNLMYFITIIISIQNKNNMYAYIHTYVHTYIRTYIHTYVHTYIHTLNYIHIILRNFFFDKSMRYVPALLSVS